MIFDDTAREYEQPLLGLFERLLVSPEIHEYRDDSGGLGRLRFMELHTLFRRSGRPGIYKS